MFNTIYLCKEIKVNEIDYTRRKPAVKHSTFFPWGEMFNEISYSRF